MNNVLFEIGVEELPARFIDDAKKQLFERTKQWLDDQRITYETIETFATPRRLAILIKDINEYQLPLTEEIRGPAQAIAQDENGEWTKAAIGFTKGQQKSVDDIYIKEIKGKPYIFVKKETKGEAAKDLLTDFPKIIKTINFPQTMHWGTESYLFARPIRWIVALYNDEVIPFSIAKVSTSNKSYGHRFLGKTVTLSDPLAYEQVLKENYVIANDHKREKMIVEQLKQLERDHNFQIDIDEQLLREVSHLVEYPTAFLGTFEQSFLSLPTEVLTTAMKEHQRYFPVKNKEGELLAYFIGVRNGTEDNIETVIKGNEKVLYARLADAVFFYEEDKKQSIDYYMNMLERIVFLEQLGTVAHKQKRIVGLTKYLLDRLQKNETDTKTALRAAEIAKLDIPTLMVDEFPELQGIIGEKYAEHFGEDKAVAKAIREHYLPKHAMDKVPSSQVGAIISIDDIIDTIVGCLAIGLIPRGSRDPYGLRRQGIGILKILLHEKWHISLEDLIKEAVKQYEHQGTIERIGLDSYQNMVEFFKRRLTYILSDENIEHDVSEAVLSGSIRSVPFIFMKARLLSKRKNDDNYRRIQEELTRVLNIVKSAQSSEQSIDETLLQTVSEKELYERFLQVSTIVKTASEQLDAEQAIKTIETLADYIYEFFENNLVMDKNEAIKTNRLTLLKKIAQLILNFADYRLIEWRK